MGEKSLAFRDETRKQALADINEQFGVAESVKQLRGLMGRVTEKDVTADTVNAACNCSSQISQTIKTVIAAAKFLAEQ